MGGVVRDKCVGGMFDCEIRGPRRWGDMWGSSGTRAEVSKCMPLCTESMAQR